MIPLSEAHVIALFVQAVLYGLYIATLAHCLRWLLYDDEGWQLREKINWVMTSIAVILFLFSTSDLGISLRFTAGPLVDRVMMAKLTNVINALENTTILIVDAVLIYRCWVVYARSWRVTFIPLVLWLACLACSILVAYYYTFLLKPSEHSNAPFHQALYAWTAFFSCSIATNIYATSAIIYRILSVAKGGLTSPEGGVRKAGRILAESGILYTLSSILNLITTVLDKGPAGEAAREVADAINFPMAGIAFNLILIRVNKRRADNHVQGQSVNTAGVLSTLQFHVSTTITHDQSLDIGDLEQGIHEIKATGTDGNTPRL